MKKKQGGDDAKKTKGWLINKFEQKILPKKKKVMSQLNQSTIEESMLMHSQVNLMKFVESWRYNIIFHILYIAYII